MVEINAAERQRLMREISDVYFIKNVRNEALICLSQAHRIVKVLRATNFEIDDITLCRLIIGENLKNTKAMREAILRGVQQTFEEKQRNPDHVYK